MNDSYQVLRQLLTDTERKCLRARADLTAANGSIKALKEENAELRAKLEERA